MTSPRRTGEPERSGDEVDAFSRRARKLLTFLGRPGVVKAAKRAFNRRVRRRPVNLGDDISVCRGEIRDHGCEERRMKRPLNGQPAHIDGYLLEPIYAAPTEQYNVYRGNVKVGFLRLDDSLFTAQIPDATGKVAYKTLAKGVNAFNEHERHAHLRSAITAIDIHIGMLDLSDGARAILLQRLGYDPAAPPTVEVRVYYTDQENWEANTFLATISAAIDKIPPEHRGTAKVTLDAGYCRYGEECDGELTITYQRPKTDVELRREIGNAKAHVKQAEADERTLFERLKAKFGGAG